ncbi:TetR/AcrR family transcriptional regulator [Spirosoma taeanense]|uniref:TetR/AcrR family transcriptional regulator n=1 Tax=Spirosoma taeanense TaxID=2735870 RepID=A0A6M5YB42_9BACT|nr:TetR/AcrR family transcriptional regulator [Spirosoma taeanense]QJW90453.1 TetR/AcrR family transcriptional regulator [Spirosoma taeanense]
MQRDRPQTEQRLISAVGQIITEEGFDQLGINRIASRAGVNKILIYRYFGGLEGLLKAYFDRNPPIVSSAPPDINQLKDLPLDVLFDTCCEYTLAEFRLLRQNVNAQEFLKASLFRTSDTPQHSVAAEREAQFTKLIDELAQVIGAEYGVAFAAIVASSMTLLTFQSQQHKTVFGLDLSTDEGWTNIEMALRHIYRGAYLFTKERLSLAEKAA